MGRDCSCSEGLCCKDDRRRWEDGDKLDSISFMRRYRKKSGNEDRLSSDIASADLSNLPLPDHRHRFETCQCSSGGSEPAEAEPRSDQTLDAPMILLDNIIQILDYSDTCIAGNENGARGRLLSSSPRPPLVSRGSVPPWACPDCRGAAAR